MSYSQDVFNSTDTTAVFYAPCHHF